MRVGSDAGGTFTDLVDERGRVVKVPSTPQDPAAAVVAGLAGLGLPTPPSELGHGTTVATNALLEGRLAAVALVTGAGVEDVLEIGRQDRPSLYDQRADRPPPLVPGPWRVGVAGRLGADGREVAPLDLAGLDALPSAAAVVAICLLHSDLDARHERAVARELAARGVDAVCSADVSPEPREFERAVTTVVSAGLRPLCGAYLRSLAPLGEQVDVLTSAGGLVPAELAAEQPAALLLSGPAGGVRAAAEAAVAAGFPDAVTFDMGGTSTDVCLVLDGAPAPAAERTVGGYPIRQPSLDVHTIGAGGGSIAHLDPGGALLVGPRSAGARPGPVAYGLGGEQPTVTDADLVAGHLGADLALPGIGRLDVDAARAALDRLGVSATDVLEVVDAAMVQAVRVVTVERGVDPSELALVAFGGAGPLHACAVAAALDMAAVVIPPRAGVLSAVGVLCSPQRRDVVRSRVRPGDHDGLDDEVASVVAEARATLGGDPTAVRATATLDVQYEGQSHPLRVEAGAGWPERFAAEHRRRNGYDRAEQRLEVVAVRAAAQRRPSLALGDLPPVEREPVTGPAVVAEDDCTIWVPAGWSGAVTADGSLVLRREPA